MAQSSYPYNPYNAYKKIVSNKGDWHTAQQLGNDPTQYYQAAMPYYQELFDNGYGDLATELSKSDYTTAKGLRDKYGLKDDNAFRQDYDYNALQGNNGGNGNGTNGGAANGSPFNSGDSTVDQLLATGTGYNDTYNDLMKSATDVATGQTAPTLSPEIQNLVDQWSANDARLNGEIRYDDNGNVISGLNTEHYNIGRNQLDYINNFDVTKQPYYDAIMQQYQLGGQKAANGEYASGASSNGGNIDSYAAANANRQQLAFTNAGQQAALAAAQQNADNWQTLYSQMSQDLTNQGTINAQTLQTAANMYATDANERMNAMDTAGALQQQAMANSINAYLAKIADDTQRYGIDAQTAMNTENNRAAMEQLVAQLASQERINSENNQTQRYGYDVQERMNAADNQTQRYGYDTQLAGTRYQADANVAMNAADNLTQRYGYDTSAATAKYQTDAQQAINSANNASALEQLYAQLQGQKELANINNAAAIKQQNIASKNAIKQKEAEYELAQKYGVTMDNKGNVTATTVDPGLTDIYSTASRMWNMYKLHQNAELQTPADVMAAMIEYDNDKYNGAHNKEITAYVKNMNFLGKTNSSDMTSIIAGLLNSDS